MFLTFSPFSSLKTYKINKGYTCPHSFILLWMHLKEIFDVKMMKPKSMIVEVDKANKTMQN